MHCCSFQCHQPQIYTPGNRAGVCAAGKGGGAAEGQKLNRNKNYLFADEVNTHVGEKIQVTHTQRNPALLSCIRRALESCAPEKCGGFGEKGANNDQGL